mmetsp:Transcript_7236/g.16134  ORF Transcript_7236/g.16134 Transcript_7236/m.16134 type:complete len:272 (-) Transcript_7236:552-1367(-)
MERIPRRQPTLLLLQAALFLGCLLPLAFSRVEQIINLGICQGGIGPLRWLWLSGLCGTTRTNRFSVLALRRAKSPFLRLLTLCLGRSACGGPVLAALRAASLFLLLLTKCTKYINILVIIIKGNRCLFVFLTGRGPLLLLLLLLLAIRLSLGPLHSLLRSLAGILHQPRIERLPRGGSREQFINTKRLGCFTVLGKMTSNEQNEDLAAVVSSAASGIILSRYVEMSLHQCQLGCGTATQRMGKSIQLLLTRSGISFQRYRPTFDLVDKITN